MAQAKWFIITSMILQTALLALQILVKTIPASIYLYTKLLENRELLTLTPKNDIYSNRNYMNLSNRPKS